MVDKIDPRYTQHITTSNTYLNCICFLRPIQSARGLYACYIGGNNFYPAEMQRPDAVEISKLVVICCVYVGLIILSTIEILKIGRCVSGSVMV